MALQPDQQQKPSEAPREARAPEQVILRVASAPRASRGGSLRLLSQRFLFPPARIPGWKGYVAAVLGVALASGVIDLIGQFIHIGNISLIYLPVVLWLATAFGRGPALLASVLAFLEYDFFFIPPLYRFTVDDPTEWVSLFAFLITALVLGQLTAVVQERARAVVRVHIEKQTVLGRLQFAQLAPISPAWRFATLLPNAGIVVGAMFGLDRLATLLADLGEK